MKKIDKTDFNKQVGNIIRHARETKDYSQYDLADITGIPRISIAQYELGNSAIPLIQFKQICKALDLDYDKVLDPVVFHYEE